MLITRKFFLAAALATMVATSAQAQDWAAIAAAVAVQALPHILEAGAKLVVYAFKKGAILANKDPHYPTLKPESNCFGILNASNEPWSLRVQKNNHLVDGRKQQGGILVYSVNASTEPLVKGGSLTYLGDLVDDDIKSIPIAPNQVFILYVDVPKIWGIKISEFLREFQIVDKDNKPISYLMTRSTKSKAPMEMTPLPDSADANRYTVAQKDGTPENKLEEYMIYQDVVKTSAP